MDAQELQHEMEMELRMEERNEKDFEDAEEFREDFPELAEGMDDAEAAEAMRNERAEARDFEKAMNGEF